MKIPTAEELTMRTLKNLEEHKKRLIKNLIKEIEKKLKITCQNEPGRRNATVRIDSYLINLKPSPEGMHYVLAPEIFPILKELEDKGYGTHSCRDELVIYWGRKSFPYSEVVLQKQPVRAN